MLLKGLKHATFAEVLDALFIRMRCGQCGGDFWLWLSMRILKATIATKDSLHFSFCSFLFELLGVIEKKYQSRSKSKKRLNREVPTLVKNLLLIEMQYHLMR